MHRLTAIFVALLLTVFVWTGTPAHASENHDCVPVAEMGAQFDGDRDETPCSQSAGTHHHSACGGHQGAAPEATPLPVLMPADAAQLFALDAFWASGRDPERQLRPPIA